MSAVTALLISASAQAATLITLHTFSDGYYPSAQLLADASGNLFGPTSAGGTIGDGTIFRLDADGGFTTLHSFSGSDGRVPTGPLIADAGGNLFGTTNLGGASDLGTIFRLDPDGGLTTLHSFSGGDGYGPASGVITDGSGNLFGTTTQGAAGDTAVGTIFRLDAGGELTTLHSFSGVDGEFPLAGLIADGAGNFFGTTAFGGANDGGTIFRLDAGGGFTTLHSFSGSDGARPFFSLIANASGNLFGATQYGGALDRGTIFKLSDAGFVVVPEPGTWAMMIAGFALVGASLRVGRRQKEKEAAPHRAA